MRLGDQVPAPATPCAACAAPRLKNTDLHVK